MKLQFLGATNTVTGSKYLLSHGARKLLVDCGLFQGYKELRLRNRAPFAIDPAQVDAVVLTHAHLDHSGYLPLLVKDGFRGKIYCSAATYDLCQLLLPDSGHLLEEEAIYANRHGFSKHTPALPLYSEADAVRALRHFHPLAFGTWFTPAAGIQCMLSPAGHILGAAIVTVRADGKTMVFSGDLGRSNDPITVAPALIDETDFLVIESTYGDKVHDPADPLIMLGKTVRETAARGGVTVIPAFAVGRAQALLYDLHRLKERGEIPARLPIYLNSPMAADTTALYRKHRREHRLGYDECSALRQAAHFVNSVAESIELNQRQVPMVIVAASGMATGGRVLHHLKAFAPDPRNTILFAGFQAAGTRGAAMLAGVDAIKIHGQYVPLRAQVAQISNLSAHADSDELMAWLRHFRRAPQRTFITHGEPEAAAALRSRIENELGWSCTVPAYLDEVAL